MRSSRQSSLVRRWLALERGDRRLLCEAWWELLVVSLRLRISPRRVLARALARGGEDGPTGNSPAASGIAQAVGSAAAHHLWTMTCLPRALTLLSMLGRRGIPARLRIGVRRAESGIAAHAWVEHGGAPLGEPEEVPKRFAPLLGIEEERESGN
jgi:hypothetical protein